MFNGVPVPIPDQFHQFIASSRASLNPLPFAFPLNGPASVSFAAFDPYPAHESLFHQQITKNIQDKDQESRLLATNLVLQRDRSVSEITNDPSWSNDEVLALLKIRSGMENWFPDFTWEHVSRKLGELGFKRSAEKCKEKFEEESRNLNINYNKNYRFFSELDQLCTGENPQVSSDLKNQDKEETNAQEEEEEARDKTGQSLEEDSVNVAAAENSSQEENAMGVLKVPNKSRKRKRRHRHFEMFKGFCEAIVSKMMAHQEELHNRLIEDMIKREEEKIAKEEAWKKQEMQRASKEMEIRAQEQAIAGDRQATIIKFLKKFTSLGGSSDEDQCLLTKIEDLLKVSTLPNDRAVPHNNLINPISLPATQKITEVPTSSSETLSPPRPPPPQNPSSKLRFSSIDSTSHENPNYSISKTKDKGDTGKRWPRDEVVALIKLRCSSLNNNSNIISDDSSIKEGGLKGPLWERISQGMMELGYQRSAKRCKEKWENINKYFRKTKDSNKKRSFDSRTCPYFHHLSSLYSQGILNEAPENLQSASAEFS